ncbi:hypothetical protein TcWFU_008942 [Taenia crassiceps]|uniref:Uncharacterized protein n=1 Tax=Taenia crassiceps TaxID=6207 RepID=A0ABR4QTX2_9CEST
MKVNFICPLKLDSLPLFAIFGTPTIRCVFPCPLSHSRFFYLTCVCPLLMKDDNPLEGVVLTLRCYLNVWTFPRYVVLIACYNAPPSTSFSHQPMNQGNFCDLLGNQQPYQCIFWRRLAKAG